MADNRSLTPAADSQPKDGPAAQTAVLLTAAEHAALERALTSLRERYRTDLADRLRFARGFGRGGDNDDLQAALEDAAVTGARIAQLERRLQRASVIDEGGRRDGHARLGCAVHVADENGHTTEYRLVGYRTETRGAYEATPASPVGRALVGARAGDVVRVELPSGRDRRLRVLGVSCTPPATTRGPADVDEAWS